MKQRRNGVYLSGENIDLLVKQLKMTEEQVINKFSEDPEAILNTVRDIEENLQTPAQPLAEKPQTPRSKPTMIKGNGCTIYYTPKKHRAEDNDSSSPHFSIQ